MPHRDRASTMSTMDTKTPSTPIPILLVEDSRFFGSVVRNRLVSELGTRVTWVRTRAQALAMMEAAPEPFFAAILDLTLPDAPEGEIVDDVLARGIPPVVLTAHMSDTTRDAMWSKRVVDYVLKEGPQAIDYVIDLVRRLTVNHRTEVLVVDDSKVARAHLRRLLEVHRYRVHEAAEGREGLDLLGRHPDIKLALVDFHMPSMDGAEFVRRARCDYRREELSIIGISGHGSGHLSARFLKSGANDFLYKPFVSEEFYCRVAENIRALDHLRTLEEMATRDFLTGLYNRRYFFATGRALCANADRKHIEVRVAMLDIDHFKRINDTHGHDAGDKVLQVVAKTIEQRFRRSDVVARLGGEEFAVLCSEMELREVARIFDELRRTIEELRIEVEGVRIPVTISIGVSLGPGGELERLLDHADQLLYQAKNTGRNRVISAPFDQR
jgi:diguanylate cyclase (GGDEF)-like protein